MTELHKLEAKVDFFKLRYNLEEKVSILVSLRGLSQTSYSQIPLKFLFLFFLSLQKDLECYAENISILKSKCHSSQCKSSGTSSLWPRKCPKGTNNLSKDNKVKNPRKQTQLAVRARDEQSELSSCSATLPSSVPIAYGCMRNLMKISVIVRCPTI